MNDMVADGHRGLRLGSESSVVVLSGGSYPLIVNPPWRRCFTGIRQPISPQTDGREDKDLCGQSYAA